MREGLVQLCSEQKSGIDSGHHRGPLCADLRLDVPVERRVDLAAIEELCQIFQGVDFALLEILGIDDSLPVFIGEARRPDKNIRQFFQCLTGKSYSAGIDKAMPCVLA